MIVAMVSVISTMGLLIAFGLHRAHHEFHDPHLSHAHRGGRLGAHPLRILRPVYQGNRDRRSTIIEVMNDLFMPMLYTSLTTAAGFASLALTPIPPVQVFGLFVATGIMVAWICTITFVPAYVMMLKESSLANFGAAVHHEERVLG